MIYQKLNTENFPQLNIVCTFAYRKKEINYQLINKELLCQK